MRMLPALALAAACSMAAAQPPDPGPASPEKPAAIQVTGQAEVSKTPDRVYIDVGVTTEAQRPEAATRENASRISAVLAAVRRVSGPSAQLTTREYSVRPNYTYPHDGGTPTIVGYTASNVVEVRLDDLSRIGRIIDAATQAGSNSVQDIRFSLRDEEAARSEALRQAALNAWQDAGTLAGALGLKVVRVLSAAGQNPMALPVYPQGGMFKRSIVAAPTPVEAGTIDVSASVTLTVEVAPIKR